MTNGIDVSEWQGALIGKTIDWPTVAKSVDFAVYRVGNGHRYDKDLSKNRDGVKLCACSGSYWYCERPGINGAGSAATQAQMWINGAEFLPGQIAQADIEGSLDGTDQPFLLDFCHLMAEYLGGPERVLVYSNLNFARNVLTDPAWSTFSAWIAFPNGSPNKGYPVPFGHLGNVIVHQWGEAFIPGISGLVDADSSLYRVDDLINQFGKTNGNTIVKDGPMFRHSPDGTIYELWMGFKIHCSAEYFYNVLGGQIAGNGTQSATGIYSYPGNGIESIPDLPVLGGGNSPAPTKFNITLNGEANA
jgi:hypothetical protein